MNTQQMQSPPYAATAVVIKLLDANRDRPIERFDKDTLSKLGVADTVIHRTIQAIQFLGLATEDGAPTETTFQLRRAHSDEYPAILQEIIRAKYKDVFQYWSPGDPPEKLENVFRGYLPMTMRPRMVRLFLGLAAYSGMIPETEGPAVRQGGPRRRKPQQRSEQPVSLRADDPGEINAQGKTAGKPRSVEHPLIRGLIDTLPVYVGDAWPGDRRAAWKTLADATFSVLYEDSSAGEVSSG